MITHTQCHLMGHHPEGPLIYNVQETTLFQLGKRLEVGDLSRLRKIIINILLTAMKSPA